MKLLNIEKIIEIYKKLITAYGGSYGVRDLKLLESAIDKAFITFDGKELYEDVYLKISVITYSIISNHSMIDGNKRLGIAVMLILLEINGVNVEYTQDELINLGMSIAKNEYKEDDIKNWIIKHRINS